MIYRRYQYWGPGAKIVWTSWFKYDTKKSLDDLEKKDIENKNEYYSKKENISKL